MTTYNGARYLPAQLESLSQQTLMPYELIVGDDGSTDGTVEILERFRDSSPFPVTIVKNPTRLGYVLNFLHLLSKTTGETVAFCDQDDIWVPDKLTTVAPYFNNPNVMMTIHSGIPVTEDLIPLPGRFPVILKPSRIPQGFSSDKTLKSFPLGFSLVFRQSVARAVSTRLLEYPEQDQFWFGHEMPVVLMARALGDTMLLPTPLVLYRRHQSNFTSGEGLTVPDSRAGLQNGPAQYRDYAAHAKARSHMLLRMKKEHPTVADRNLAKLALVSETLSDAMDQRATLYELPRGLLRWGKIFSMSRHGVYRARYRGGLGARSWLKDIWVTLRD